MSRNEDIDNAIWDDPDFESLGPYATLLYLWSFTNPRCGMAGIYKVSHSKMTESKVPLAEIPGALAELEAARFAFYEGQVLWIRARVKRLRSRSPQMAKAVVRDLHRVSNGHSMLARFMDEYASDPWLRDALSETYRDPIGNLSEKPIGKGDSHRVSTPSREGAGTIDRVKGSSSSSTENVLPESFPRELLPHLDAVVGVLTELAGRHKNAKAVGRRAVALVMTPNPYKPFVTAAYDCAAYWDSRNLKDAVAAYRNWLKNVDDLADFEVLGQRGSASPGRGPSSSRERVLSVMDGWKDSPEYKTERRTG